MGLDQHLFRTTRENFDHIKAVRAAHDRYFDRVDEVVTAKYRNELRDLSHDAAGRLGFSLMSAGQKANFDALDSCMSEDRRRIAEGFGFEWRDGCVVVPELADGDEIGYWRNDWTLHAMIVVRFWNAEKGDNCVRIPLDERALLEILEWDAWGVREDETSRNEWSAFADALDAVRSGLAAYYMAWY